jgi:hypothetical protein
MPKEDYQLNCKFLRNQSFEPFGLDADDLRYVVALCDRLVRGRKRYYRKTEFAP